MPRSGYRLGRSLAVYLVLGALPSQKRLGGSLCRVNQICDGFLAILLHNHFKQLLPWSDCDIAEFTLLGSETCANKFRIRLNFLK